MLRALILLLVLANLSMLAWTQGWLDGVVGVRADGDREPERLTRQIRPDSVQILPAGAASAARASAASAAASVADSASAAATVAATQSCIEAGPYSDAQLAAAKSLLHGMVPQDAVTTVDTRRPGTWMVYMGKFANPEALQKKEEELKRRKLTYEVLQAPPDLAPGLSLGRFDAEQSATRALESLSASGVRTARVAQLAPELVSHRLRIEHADEALATHLTGLHARELGAGFSACSAFAER